MTRRLGLVVALILSIAACADLGAAETPTASPPPTPAPTATPERTFRQPSADALGQLVGQIAGHFEPRQSELGSMWQQVFETMQVTGQRPYEPPSGVAPYLPGEIPPVECARGTAARDWPAGAFYCPADGWIVYDETWLREFQGLQGEFAPAAILGHEWGHHVGSLFGNTQYDIQNELFADCLAGMHLAYRELPPGATEIVFQSAEFNDALVTFFGLANQNYSDLTWFQADEHGSPFQRMLAFGTGALPLDRGLQWCYGYREFAHEDFAEIGRYRLVNFPGRTESTQGDAYVIAPENRVTVPSSQISLQWLDELPLGDQRGTFDQLAALASTLLPGSSLIVPGVNIADHLGVGTGWMALYDASATDPEPRSGIIAVVAPDSDPGGLVINVSRAGPAPPDPPGEATLTPDALDVLAEQVGSVYQTTTRLCGPDQSSHIEAAHWNMSCVEDQ